MLPHESFDNVPIWAILVGFLVAAFVAFEGGYRLGLWWHGRRPDKPEGASGLVVGSLVGLLGFLLAVTTAMASDRYDARRGLIVEEADSIRTTYLRAGYLPEPYRSEARNLLREYVPLR